MPIYTKLHNAIKSRVIRYGVKKILGDTNFIDQVCLLFLMFFIGFCGILLNLLR